MHFEVFHEIFDEFKKCFDYTMLHFMLLFHAKIRFINFVLLLSFLIILLHYLLFHCYFQLLVLFFIDSVKIISRANIFISIFVGKLKVKFHTQRV